MFCNTPILYLFYRIFYWLVPTSVATYEARVNCANYNNASVIYASLVRKPLGLALSIFFSLNRLVHVATLRNGSRWLRSSLIRQFKFRASAIWQIRAKHCAYRSKVFETIGNNVEISTRVLFQNTSTVSRII